MSDDNTILAYSGYFLYYLQSCLTEARDINGVDSSKSTTTANISIGYRFA